jgi:5-methylcytosine-specific restriction protein A
MKPQLAYLARPDLPKPNCRVILICGPPAAGKSTYVRARAGRDDIVIDLDMIAREHGWGRNRPASELAMLLTDRNGRLAALAKEPPERVAWVILGAPAPSLRQWWAEALGVRPHDMIVLTPSRQELYRRIRSDPDRKHVQQQHFALVDKWLARERADNPGIARSGCGPDGYPTDTLHPWHRNSAREL